MKVEVAALIPKPRVNLTRFLGVFTPNSKWRMGTWLGGIQIRRIWATIAQNDYVDFPHDAQTYKVEKQRNSMSPGMSAWSYC
ncbi:MAG: hypothetical protein GY829_09040 [Gammaproteobacteria bacterium]|nr:hypothetical protein [Gammaproteobacteria bacterium]